MRVVTDAIDTATGLFDSRYTCDIDNSSPELRWDDPPEGTVSFAVLAEDLDAGPEVFSHWVVYNLPASLRHLPAGIPPQDTLPNGIRQGVNSWGKLGYGGPCPPIGARAHRYRFRVFALGASPEVATRPNRVALLQAIEGKVLAEAQIEGLYRRALERAG
jgi:Raf kinase inhibitor-like YbhB/YbcL family protein